MPDGYFESLPIPRKNVDLAGMQQNIANLQSGLAQEILDRESADATKANKTTTINGKSLAEDRVIYAQDIPSKNLLPNTASTTTTNGVTFTVNADGSVTVNGTASADATLILYTLSNDEKAAVNGCVLSGCPSGGSISKYFLMVQQSAEPRQVYATDTGNGATITNSSQGSYGAYVYIRVCSGQTVSNLTFRPMIRLASIEDDSYVPYAKTNVELSQGSSGAYYTKLPDGTMIQWGYATIPANATKVQISYPYAFVGAVSITALPVYSSSRNVGLVFGADSTTGVDIYRSDVGLTTSQPLWWQAIGRWK